MIKYYEEMEQGSDAWFAARCGLLTASEMKHIITPKKLAYAENDKEKSHLYELAAQRITKYVEPSYVSDDMLRGRQDEIDARLIYHEKYAPIHNCGFITNDKWGFTLGYSPDFLISDEGQGEVKGRRQKYHLQTIVTKQIPDEYVIQVQTGLLVSERDYCEYISYCGGMPMYVLPVRPDAVIQDAIVTCAATFHEKLERIIAVYGDRLVNEKENLTETERRPDGDIII